MQTILFRVLIAFHTIAGTAALSGGFAAYLTRKGGPAHRRAGTLFVFGMFAIVATTLLILTMRPSPELLVQAILSAYLVTSGWRAVLERAGRVRQIDWIAATVCFAAGFAMLVYSTIRIITGQIAMVEIAVLAGLTVVLTMRDLLLFRRGGFYRNRLVRHAGALGGALLGAAVAFAAVLVRRYPSLTWWTLAVPVVILLPAMIYWWLRLRRSNRSFGTRVPASSDSRGIVMTSETVG
jgi:uncharacterized membrane protein